jgi:hypothetical protein
MKKLTAGFFFLIIFSGYQMFSENNISFIVKNDFQLLLQNQSADIFREDIKVINFSKVLSTDEVNKAVSNIELSNIILSGIGMAGYTANAIMGGFILAEKFQDQPYENGLLYAHIPAGVISGLTDATVISLGYAEIGLRNKYQLGYSNAHAISIYISTGFAILEVGMVVANLITSRLNPEAAKWVGVAHAVTTASALLCLTVQFGISFTEKKPE